MNDKERAVLAAAAEYADWATKFHSLPDSGSILGDKVLSAVREWRRPRYERREHRVVIVGGEFDGQVIATAQATRKNGETWNCGGTNAERIAAALNAEEERKP